MPSKAKLARIDFLGGLSVLGVQNAASPRTPFCLKDLLTIAARSLVMFSVYSNKLQPVGKRTQAVGVTRAPPEASENP
jgi:hypothetical protein